MQNFFATKFRSHLFYIFKKLTRSNAIVTHSTLSLMQQR